MQVLNGASEAVPGLHCGPCSRAGWACIVLLLSCLHGHSLLPGCPALCPLRPSALDPHLLPQEHGSALCVHFVGVHPERQGRGLGGAMLRHLCEQADAARRHLYLEASWGGGGVGGVEEPRQAVCPTLKPCLLTGCLHLCALRHAASPRSRGELVTEKGVRAPCASHAPSHTCSLLPQASTERSQALYARHGFTHIADKPLGEAGEERAPVLRVMVRPPSSATLAAGAD